MLVVACPGQGSQTPGFLSPWLQLSGAEEFFALASDACGVDLVLHGTRSCEDTIRDTAVAQPLIVAASVFAGRVFLRDVGERLRGDCLLVAGHSVGEFAAAAFSGVLSDFEALRLVGVRARAMARAASASATGMSAVVGGRAEDVSAVLRGLGLTAANMNGAGQVVAAGEVSALERLRLEPPRGARVIPLRVAGAFHTEFMGSAVSELREAVAQVTPADPVFRFVGNESGKFLGSGVEVVRGLVGQVVRPVRWDACLETFVSAGVTGFVELCPAGALTGIAKRGLRGVSAVAVRGPEDLSAAVDLALQVFSVCDERNGL